jgi:hypothetical protein
MSGSTLNPLGPVAGAYCNDNSEIAVIMGPVGSAKTTGSMLRLARHAWEQQPWNGVARTRFAIVRNTGPQLTDTTMKSWFKLFPTDNKYRKYTSTTKTAVWHFPITDKSGKPAILHSEFLFRALDDDDDVANLLSLEVTGLYFNEFREINTSIFANSRARYGRFPGADMGGCTWQGAIGDTNPWAFTDDFHDMFVVNPRPNFSFFHQPGGLHPDAENLENLNQNQESIKLPLDDPHRRALGKIYYERLLDTYKQHEADMYVHSKYGVSRAGKPVFPSYDDNAHIQVFELQKDKDGRVPIKIGYDNTGRNPSALIAQRTGTGQWRCRYEFVGQGIGMKAHAAALRSFIAEKIPNSRIERITCDPAGRAKGADDLDMRMVIQREFPGVQVINARTNDIETRVDAGESVFRRLVVGGPAILIHPDCKTLRAALTHKYQYRKLKIAGDERYTEIPDKISPWADIADALQYLLLGGGEGRVNSGGGQEEMWGTGPSITPLSPDDVKRKAVEAGEPKRWRGEQHGPQKHKTFDPRDHRFVDPRSGSIFQ